MFKELSSFIIQPKRNHSCKIHLKATYADNTATVILNELLEKYNLLICYLTCYFFSIFPMSSETHKTIFDQIY